MAQSGPTASSTTYDPFLISKGQEGGGLSRSYTDTMNNNQGFIAVGGAAPAEDSSGKVSKSSWQFHKLEIPRQQSMMFVKSQSRMWTIFAWAIKYYLIVILVALALGVELRTIFCELLC
jgi:hypothetical protein